MKVLFSKLTLELKRLNIITAAQGDQARKQYDDFIEVILKQYKPEFRDFNSKVQRLDDLFFKAIGNSNEYNELWLVIKCVFVCFITQAKIERGFSENKNQLY